MYMLARFFLLLVSFQLCAGSWGMPMVIDPSGRASPTAVFTSYDTLRNLTMATWHDFLSDNPMFSLYNGTSWTVPVPIEMASIKGNVFSSYNEDLDLTIATWTDNVTGKPVYAQYDGVSWAVSMPIASDMASSESVFTAFALNKTYAAWLDQNDVPQLSAYDGISWTAPMPIDPGHYRNLTINSLDTSRNYTYATWVDSVSSMPYFVIYNGSSWTVPMPIAATTAVGQLAFCTYEPDTKQTFAIWLNSMLALEFSIHDGVSWSAPAPVMFGFGVGLVFLSSDVFRNQVVATWIDPLSRPVYAVYTP